ncbi:uncharacterized protein LOC115322212 [Ixodes scapularis]|uniref:uncharacterized protein LOC115322212 n=1 Tax=Ixodes scapularis TaxID=6945 RepID=UPI001AD727F9|nr:uncharacterized protein LOC115322212 [Ixodes scapularis]
MAPPMPKNDADLNDAQSSDRPRIVLPWSLRQRCLDEVSRNVWRWSKSLDEGSECSGGTPSTPLEDNPFVDYPVHVRQDLLESILDDEGRSPAVRRVAELLLVSGLESFDLSCLDDFSTVDLQFILQLLEEHGSSLRELTISGLWMFSSESEDIVRRLLSAASNLRVLRIQDIYRDNFEVLVRSCPLLQRLEVMHHSINADDIDSVTRIVQLENLPVQQSLMQVSLPASVDGEGIISLIETFPNLQIVRCVYLESVLDSLDSRTGSGQREWWENRLSRIHALQSGHPMGWGSVERLVAWFPQLEEVVLHVQDGMNIRELSKLKRLRSLELRNSPTIPSSYTDDVLPLLALCGRRLLRLGLEHFDVIDLGRTNAMCPDLEALSLRWFILLGCSLPVTHSRTVAVKPFQNLRELTLRPRVGRLVHRDACELLLSHCQNIRHIELFCGGGLNDSLALLLCKRNGFPKLRSLRLRHGHALSADGLQSFLSKASNLKFWNAGKFTRRSSLGDDDEDEAANVHDEDH